MIMMVTTHLFPFTEVESFKEAIGRCKLLFGTLWPHKKPESTDQL